MKSLQLMMTVFALATMLAGGAACADSFQSGDIVVYRVGTGASSLVNTGNAVFLDEYTPAGALVQSVPMPTTRNGANYPLIASGTATSEGFLTLSTDGQYLMLTGYGTTTGGSASLSSTPASQVPRVVARVDANGNIDTTTALVDYESANNPRTAISTDGTNIWLAGPDGIRYTTLGSTTSTLLATSNVRQVSIVNNQLYISTQSSGKYVDTVGSGVPITDSPSVTSLVLSGGTLSKPDGFFFADLNNSPGPDTLYIADEDTTTGGLLKYCLNNGVWTYEGEKGNGSNLYRGLTGVVEPGVGVVLYTTRKGGSGASGGGELASLLDSTGYDGNLSSTTGSFVTLATAPNDEAFRGVALAPTAVPEPSACLLLGVGVIALLACARRRRDRTT